MSERSRANIRHVLRGIGLAVLVGVIVPGCAHSPRPSELGTVAGRVVDDHGVGIPGARVTLVGQPVNAVAHPDGSFVFDGVPAGLHTLTATANGFWSIGPKNVRVEKGRTSEPVELDLY